jgi:proteasome accessory factor B
MLHGEDQDARGTRNFLLGRIVTPITATRQRHAPFSPDAADRALAELEEIWTARTAVVEVVPGSDAQTRLAKRRGTQELPSGALSLHYTDVNLFADELAGFGPEALVLSPPELRAAVLARLERTAADHG